MALALAEQLLDLFMVIFSCDQMTGPLMIDRFVLSLRCVEFADQLQIDVT
jgi:hypothetical protein